MNKFLVGLVLLLSVCGCDKIFPKVISSEIREYEVIGVHRPKHFRLDLKDVKVGSIYRHVNISKHCDAWRKVKVGQRWEFLEVTFQRGEDRYRGVRQIGNFCERLGEL